MDGTYYNLDFDYGISWDRRNQPFQPTSGYITKFEQSLPIVIDKSSIYNGFTASGYRAFGEDIIGSVKFMARSIHGLENEDVRLRSSTLFHSSSLILIDKLSRVIPALLINISILFSKRF